MQFDKHPGVCPISISDVPRRIVLLKPFLYAIGDDFALGAGPFQICAG